LPEGAAWAWGQPRSLPPSPPGRCADGLTLNPIRLARPTRRGPPVGAAAREQRRLPPDA